MKKYFEEIIIFLLQLAIFYIFPTFATENNPMGIMVIILMATFITSLAFGGISQKRIRYYYPVIIAIFFIPTVYVYNVGFEVLHSL